MIPNKIIQKHLNIADKLAVKYVEKIAREILINNPNLKEFTMAMGSFFFSDKDGIIHSYQDEKLEKIKGYKKLDDFICKWDDLLKITGTPMTFTTKGKKITNW